MSQGFWTDKRVEKLKELWTEGVTAGKIARAIGYGVTRNAVIGKANRLQLPARKEHCWRSGRPPTPAAPAAALRKSHAA